VFDLPGGVEGNPGDAVEVPADVFILPAINGTPEDASADTLQERIDWWLGEFGDE